MAAPTTSQESLDQAALGPKSVTKNGHAVVQRDLKELRDQAAADAQQAVTDVRQLFGNRTRLINGPRQ